VVRSLDLSQLGFDLQLTLLLHVDRSLKCAPFRDRHTRRRDIAVNRALSRMSTFRSLQMLPRTFPCTTTDFAMISR
jgi:hypothetical protein